MFLKFLSGLFVYLVFLCAGCKQTNKLTEKDYIDFFYAKKWNGDYASTLPLHNLDSMVLRIKADVPLDMQNLACENAYYHLPESPHDTLQSKFLNKIESAFPNDSMHAFVLLLRGYNFGIYYNYDSSFKCLTECYNISIKDKRLVRASDAQLLLGIFSANRNDYPEGIRLVNEAYKMALSLGDNDGGRLIEIMISTAIIYRNIEDYVSEQYWIEKLWDYSFAKSNRSQYQIRAAGYMAENYLRLHQLDSAKYLIDTTFKLMEINKYRSLEGFYLTIRAEIEIEQGNTTAAFLDLKTALHDSAIMLQPRFRTQYNKVLGFAHLAKNKLDSALFYFNKSLISTDTLFQANVESQIAKVYEKKGNIALALSHQSKSINLSNRVLSATKERALERIQLKNEAELKSIEAEYKNKSVRQWEITGIMVFATFFFVSLLEIKRQKQQKLILVKEKEIVEIRERLKTLALEQSENKITVQQNALNESSKLIDFKNTLINSLELRLAEQTASDEEIANFQTEVIPTLRSMRILTQEDWIRFSELFDLQYPKFRINLKIQFSNLSNSETRLFLLIKAGFEANEIASVTGVSMATVYTSRYRLRKKLDLIEENDLEKYVQSFRT